MSSLVPVLDSVNCHGSELNLFECMHRGSIGQQNCSSSLSAVAGVTCRGERVVSVSEKQD